MLHIENMVMLRLFVLWLKTLLKIKYVVYFIISSNTLTLCFFLNIGVSTQETNELKYKFN